MPYCSVACYKQHKDTSSDCKTAGPGEISSTIDESSSVKDRPIQQVLEDVALEDPKPLIPLTALKWPYIPEESAYPDPLKRDDPKVLQLHQYEAIATSATIRKVLNEHPNLINMLSSIDTFRGPEREQALQRALGVTAQDISNQFKGVELSEDVLAIRRFAEAVEAAVRGENEAALGLNWDPSEV